MSRLNLVKIHLAFASLFFPFLLIMPITGGFHLVGVDGSTTKTAGFTITDPVPSEESEWPAFFREQFKKAGVNYEFEVIRGREGKFTFRPTSRVHYVSNPTARGLEMTRVEPDLLKSLFELHMGHGPKFMRWVEAVFALCLVIAALSGAWLALTNRVYRPVMLVSFGVGLVVIGIALL